ncbi:MAG TPA: hypothetical protein DCE43_03705, partial [Planctomycetaceae bacterium]|nr:hypothetical protein [Planctomycetaceae bacterium]
MRFSDWLIPLRQPTHRGRNQHRRPRVAALLEMLEDRVMLSGVTGVDYQEVDADWFATLGQKTTSSASAGPAGAYGHGQGNLTGDHDNSQWIVRLSSDAVELAPGVHTVQCVLDTGDYPLKVLGGLGLPGQVLVDSGDAPTDQVRELLADHPLVSSFEANLGVRGQETFPDDPRFSEEVGLHNTGQSNGLADADIDAPEAWDITTGSSDVVVAVVDSGVDYLHPDLQNNIWINTGEIAGNGIDDDGNGFVDDIHGYDFQANDADPMDEHRHGTHVAGVVAGDGNNSLGISGVTWSSTIMPLRFLDSNNSGLTSDAVRAINYATMMRTDHGVNVRVINNSWGSEGERSNSTALHDAIQAAGNSGILVTAAAGNGNAMGFGFDLETLPFYPASYDLDNVVGVAATGQFDELARFSNFNNQDIDLAAPGVGILSTFPRNQGEYSQLRGTSFATPQVSGTAALIWSELPDATVAEVRAALLQGVDSISALDGKVVTGGRLNAHGSLTIDTYATRATLTAVDDVTTKDITSHDMTIDYADNVAIDVSSIDDSDIIVRRQDGAGTSIAATRVSVTPDGNGTDRTVVYRIVPPGGSWDSGENGDWEIVLLGGRVLDTAGNASPEQILGDFNVTLPLSGPFQVNSFSDTVDADPGDGLAEDANGNITLRSAIMESNAVSGEDTIQLEAGTYTLSLAGADEDAAATGDLDITDTLNIIGRGINTTTIDANDLDRLLHIPDDANFDVRLTDLTLTNGAVTGNGGGILNGGRLELTRVKIASSTATGSGGGIYNSITSTNDPITITGSHLADNQAGGGGGGLYTTEKALITDSTFSGNTAGLAGGGLLASASDHEIIGVTFSGNQAGTDGGAFYSVTGISLLKHVTMVENTAADSGGGVRINTGLAYLANSLIAKNTSTNDNQDVDVSGDFYSVANNLIGDIGSVTGIFGGNDLFGSAASPLDPKLASLTNNGGTSPTHYPLIDSPVIDVGHDNHTTDFDQRGIARREDGDGDGQGTTDIGAVEFVLYTEIHGTRYHDRNSNGTQDTGEEPMADFTVFLDANDNGDLDTGEISTTTDVDGNYSFVDLLPGDYIVREVTQNGWRQTSPDPVITQYVINPVINSNDAALVETDSGTTNLVFDVTLTHPLLQTVTVDYTTADGTADGSDFEAASGTLTFAPGETSRSIIVAITGDTDNEPHETLVVDLSNPGNATLGDAQATGTIYDNDAGFMVNSTDDTVDANPGDGLAQDDQGRTTLRAAIMEANALAGDDAIFVPSGTYTLTISGTGEDSAATGDLDVTDTSGTLRITGAGTDLVTIDGSDLDRVIDIHAGTTTEIAFLSLENGLTIGGDIGAGLRAIGSELTLNGIHVTGNESATDGGGLAVTGSSTVTLNNSLVTLNQATGADANGGGLHIGGSDPVVTLHRTTVSGNTSTGAGGGIYSEGNLTFDASVVSGNTAANGGGIAAQNQLELTNTTVSENTATAATTGHGGGLNISGSNPGDRLFIEGSTFSGNQAAATGGGAQIAIHDAVIKHSTFSGNTAEGNGGAIAFRSPGGHILWTLQSNTIADNQSQGDGGGVYHDNSHVVTVTNTILATNRASGSPDVHGDFDSGGHNLIGDKGGSSGFTDGTDGDQVGTASSPIDPLLGPLSDNGGSGPTHRPLVDSPVIDSGDPSLRDRLDQRAISGISNAGGVTTFLFEDPVYEHTITSEASQAQSVFAVDLDGDGDTDVLSGASGGENEVLWHENDGNGDFTLHVIAYSLGEVPSIFAADVDGDGDMDVLATSEMNEQVVWFENDGNQSFSQHVIKSSVYSAGSVFAADVDGDGDMDVLSASFFDDKIAWYENDGNEAFTEHTITTTADGARSVFAADVDNDGDIDVISASYNGDTIHWYENDGNESFTAHTITTTADGPLSVYTADVDGDGDMDVLSASLIDKNIAWYENDGNESFTTHTITTTANGAMSVFAADVDGDGDIDVLTASDDVAWYENDGNETFAKPHTIATDAQAAMMAYPLDVDGDGDIDLVTASQGDHTVAWYENNGSEIFTEHQINTNARRALETFPADIDNDGDIDVVSASYLDDTIAWYENDGSETFTTHVITTQADYAAGVYAIDVDADGDTDVLTASQDDDTIAWYENDGNQNFSQHVITANADGAVDVLASDLDEDGDIDVLSASYVDNKIAWYENNGSESFTEHIITTTAAVCNGPRHISTADLDGDGDIDVLSASFRDDKIAWYENDGSENFSNHTITSDADGARGAYAADIDNDGDLDVVTASSTDDTFSYYENDGNQNFSQHVINSSADGAFFAFPTDIDKDGDIDVVSASYLDNTFAWYENAPRADIGAIEQEYELPHAGSHTLTLTPGQVVSGSSFGGVALPGEISGTKFHDVNENGVHDGGEAALSGWTIYLDQNSNDTLDPGEATTTTDADGNYQFTNLPPLVDYTVREVLQSGWLQTAPASTSHVVSLDAGGNVVDKDFGNALIPGEIHGSVFRDDDSDGIWDAGEPALEGWNVFLDDNDDGEWESGETKTVTDEDGLYSFTDLDPLVTYHVGEDRHWTLQLTAPQPVTGDATVGVEPFATDTRLKTAWDITRASDGSFYITGLDGIRSGFNAQAIFHVSADGSNVDIQTPANQPRGVTGDENYLYYVDTALSGSGMGIYRRPIEGGGTREQILDGQAASPPITSARDVEFVTVGESSLLIVNDDHAGRVFKVTLGGTSPVVEQLGPDRYADSADRRHASQIVVEGDTVYLADTGVAGFGDTPVRVLSIGLDDDDFTELFSGSTDDYSLRGIAVGDETIFLADEDEILQLPVTGGTPTQLVGHPRFGDLQGMVFHNDTLHVLDNINASHAITWQITLNSASTVVAHHIHNNWDVALAPAAVITGRNFGIHDTDHATGQSGSGEITGHWFNDIDGDGVQDTGEPGLPNRTVYLDLNNNGMLEAGEPSTVSLQDDVNSVEKNEAGYYSFASLVAGDYTISAADESDGWTQTLPLETGYAAHTLSAADGPAGVGTIDANDDGHLDLVATNRDTNTVSIFTATGNGDYLDPVEYEVGVG